MKTISLLFIILVPSLATKEYADDISQLLDDPDLILELVKRLGKDMVSSPSQKKSFPDSDKHSPSKQEDRYIPLVHGDSRSCKSRLFERTIIRTDDSVKAGAKFLDSEENVDTIARCLEMCCSKSGCDLAVYENKTKHNCYLFKCRDRKGENKCKFDSHDDYISTTITAVNGDDSKTAPPSSSKEKSKEDNLGASLEKVTEESKPVPSKPESTPRPTQLPHSVALGRWCQKDISCEDPYAVCFEDACHCQHNYNQKNGICRRECDRDQVECKRRGTARIGPDCIPKSQVCDGTTQCADGSDERDCKTGNYQDGNPNPSFTHPQDNWEEKPTLSQDGDLPSSSDNSQTVDEAGTSESSEDKTDSSPASKEQPSGVLTSDNTDNSQNENKKQNNKETEQTSSDTEPTQDKVSDKGKVPLTEGGKNPESASTEVKTTTSAQKRPEVEVVNKEEKEETVFVTKEKVIVASPTDNAQGPIVALSLGLAITLMLLVFVGCRLRNVRHRLRKGRPLHSNEADYLINGMYL